MSRATRAGAAALCTAAVSVLGFTGVFGSGSPSAAPSAALTAQGIQQKVDSLSVSKAYTNATATTSGVMLIKASSSDPAAVLTAYRPDGSVIGWVQNGGGGKYGGTVMPSQAYDPITVTIKSSAGGSITVPTTAFQI